VKGKAGSTTYAAIADSIITTTKEKTEKEIRHDTENALNKLSEIFDKKKTEEKQELVNLMSQTGFTLIGDIADRKESELKRKGYLETKGKKICASSDGIELLKLVPELVRNPILTAVFERKLRDVESGKSTLSSFIESQQKFILQEINKAKAINNGLQ